MVTVQLNASGDIESTIAQIKVLGARAGVGLELSQPTSAVAEHMTRVDRVLIMGTAVGVKGVGQDPATAIRVAEVVEARAHMGLAAPYDGPELVVDGGIRSHTVARLARAGADGVVPGSLIFNSGDPVQAVRNLNQLAVAHQTALSNIPTHGSGPRVLTQPTLGR